jgi:hypothetical protein
MGRKPIVLLLPCAVKQNMGMLPIAGKEIIEYSVGISSEQIRTRLSSGGNKCN